MIALSLYDVLARKEGGGAPSELGHLLDQLAASALDELRQFEEYERQFLSPRGRSEETELRILRSIWRLFDGWSQEAEQLLDRVREHAASGERVASAEALEDAYRRVRARLGLTPERIIRARRQARERQLTPAKELRIELNARLHA